MRVAIIGCGSIGTRHLKNALALGCEVTAYDSDPARQSALRTEFPDVSVLGVEPIAPPPPADAVIVATPYDQHLAIVQGAVWSRMPLFVEKPLGSLDQIEDWRRLVEQSQGLVTQVGYQCRFHPKARAMKLLFPTPASASFGCFVDMKTWPGKSYGPLWVEASHDLDMALWLGAEPRVACVSAFGVNLGDDWSVDIRESDHYLRWWSVGTDSEGATVEFDSPDALGDQMYVDELAHFLDCVQSGRQTLCPLGDGLRVLEVCAEIERLAGKSPALNGVREC